MDDKRFDALSKSLAARPTRRRSLLAGGGGALLGLLGLGAARAQDDDLGGADQTPTGSATETATTEPSSSGDDDLCRMEFTATVRTGPTLDGGASPTLSGVLTFRLGEDAEIVPGESQLEAEAGNRYPVTGQTRGRAVSLRINLGPSTLVAIGTAERSARSCAGEIRGVTIGPLEGDLGDWVASADLAGASSGPSSSSASVASSGSTSATSQGAQSSGSSPATATSTAPPAPTATETATTVTVDATLSTGTGNPEEPCPRMLCYEGMIVVRNNGVCECACPADNMFCYDRCCGPDQLPCIPLPGGHGQCGCPDGMKFCTDQCVPCPGGTCTCPSACPPGQTFCGDHCVDLLSDPDHCGACFNACRDAFPCQGGACGVLTSE